MKKKKIIKLNKIVILSKKKKIIKLNKKVILSKKRKESFDQTFYKSLLV